MKKFIVLIISLFFFISNCYATQMASESMDVIIKKDGSADVTLSMTFLAQRDTVYKMAFFNVENSKISNISIEDNYHSHQIFFLEIYSK